MIVFDNISKSYNGRAILSDINATFEKGQITTILGSSGCGKSTLLKLINKTILPEAGSISINGENIKYIDSTALRRNIGYVIQNVGLFPHMTIKENIGIVPRLLKWNKSDIDKRVNLLMEMVGLSNDYLNKYPIQLSGGEAGRVGVARALAANPEILLMDEPFGALDPTTRKKLQDEVLNIQKHLKKTILFVTHDISEALYMANEIVLIKDKRIVEKTTPFDIISNKRTSLSDFAGGSFTLELLEKVKIIDIIDLLEPVNNSPSQYFINPELSLKTALSEMVFSGNEFVCSSYLDNIYKLDLLTLTRVIRGDYLG